MPFRSRWPRGGSLEQAVIFDPNRNELFTASKGGGAFLNERRIRVSKRTKLQDALIGTGFPYRMFEHIDTYLAIFKELAQKTSGQRRPGAASLDLVAGTPKVFAPLFNIIQERLPDSVTG